MSKKPSFQLELLYDNIFNDKYPELNQAQIEAKYLEEFKTFKKSNKLSSTLAWRKFQEDYGTLLAPDPNGKWGDGRSLFRASITSDGELSVSTTKQVRAWRTQFLTEGSPGTKLALKDTGKQFYDSKTGHALQVHHAKGIAEYGPFIDQSLKKLINGIRGGSNKLYKEGVKEYNTFKKWAFQTGRIFGDKVENYQALAKNQHINIPGSVHELRSPTGPFYSVKASGGSAFDSDAERLKTKLKPQIGLDDVSLTSTQDLLNKANRTTFTKNYDITKPGSIWDQMGEWSDLTEQSTEDAVALARQIANPEDRPYIQPKIDEARIRSTNIDDQIPVIKKIAAQYEANEGLSRIDAINKAKIEYNRIRYGKTFAKGIDTAKLGLIKSIEIAKELTSKVPKPIKGVAKRGSKYVLPAVGIAIAGGHRELRAAEYEEDPNLGNLVQKKIAQVQEGIEYVDTVTGGASNVVTWIPNLAGDVVDSAIETTQDPNYKPQGSYLGIKEAIEMSKKLQEQSKLSEEEKKKNSEHVDSIPNVPAFL